MGEPGVNFLHRSPLPRGRGPTPGWGCRVLAVASTEHVGCGLDAARRESTELLCHELSGQKHWRVVVHRRVRLDLLVGVLGVVRRRLGRRSRDVELGEDLLHDLLRRALHGGGEELNYGVGPACADAPMRRIDDMSLRTYMC